MYELSCKLDLSINTKYNSLKNIIKLFWWTSAQHLSIVIGFTKPEIKDMKYPECHFFI